MVLALICWSVVEVVLRQDMALRPLLLAALAVVASLPWRRAHPLVAVTVAFGTLTVVDIVRILTGSQALCPQVSRPPWSWPKPCSGEARVGRPQAALA